MRLLTVPATRQRTIEMLGRPFSRSDRTPPVRRGRARRVTSFYPYLSGRENLQALASAGAKTPRGRVDEVLEIVGLRDAPATRCRAIPSE